MVELLLGPHRIDRPYTVRITGVSDDEFDELVDEDVRAELIDGVMIVHSPASMPHDNVTDFVRGLMGWYAEETDAGMMFGPDSLVRMRLGRRFGPDGYFVREENVPDPLPREFHGIPDLMLETLSPSNSQEDLDVKRPLYRAARVGEIWIVDTFQRRVLIDYKQRRGYREVIVTEGRAKSVVLPGFWIDVEWLWRPRLPKKLACLRKILAK